MRLYALSHQVRDTATGLFWITVFIVAVAALSIFVTGCAGINAGLGAGIVQADADAAGAAKNIEALNDRAFRAWQVSAGALTLGAIGRNGTGNPMAVQAALMAAGVSNVGVVGIQNGQVIMTTGPNLTTPYAAPITPAALNAAPLGSVLTVPK